MRYQQEFDGCGAEPRCASGAPLVEDPVLGVQVGLGERCSVKNAGGRCREWQGFPWWQRLLGYGWRT
jgi:hypothetical protein